jgi:hypothetical protein
LDPNDIELHTAPGGDVTKGVNLTYFEFNVGYDWAEAPFVHIIKYDGVQVSNKPLNSESLTILKS